MVEFRTATLVRREFSFQVIHLCGDKDFSALQSQYSQGGVPYRLFPFLEDMDRAYSAADLVISRAGAVTVSEIACFACPAILVPYPYAGGHQLENAKVLVQTGAARMVEESALNSGSLKELILKIKNSNPDREPMTENLRSSFLPDASRRVAQAILDVAA